MVTVTRRIIGRVTITMLMTAMVGSAAIAGDLDALALADQTPVTAPVKVDAWSFLCEATAGWISDGEHDNAPSIGADRLSCDTTYNKTFSPHWQVVFANRVDVLWTGGQRNEVDTLREAFVDWRLNDRFILDAGRINEKLGAGFGYNPTDFFKVHSIRDVLSVNPDSLRSSRLGTVMLRGQTLWSTGSVSAIAAPKIESQATDAPFNPDFGATNNETRWMIFGSQKIVDDLAPQWLVYGSDHTQPQFGMNLTALLNQATVAYLEWAGGHERSQFATAIGEPAPTSFQNRLTAGLTYTTREEISITLEFEYNAAALDRDEERRAIGSDVRPYYQYLGYVSVLQELSTRQAYFVFLSWNNVGVRNLNLNVFERYAPADSSRVTWGQIMYRFPKFDVTIERLMDSGSPASAYGNTLGSPRLQATFAYYF